MKFIIGKNDKVYNFWPIPYIAKNGPIGLAVSARQ